MTEHEINFNYSKAMGQAAELKNIAKSLASIGNNVLEVCLGSVEKNWKGTNSEDYVKKGKKVQTKISTSSQNINAAASAIESMAKRIYEAEMAALRAARERKYNH